MSSALAQLQASPWLEHIAAHISSQNWFVLANDVTPVQTARGTRPGSSWADVLFALLMPRILQHRDGILGQLQCASSKPAFPWDGCLTLDPLPGEGPSLDLREVIWADDLATPKVCETPAAVESALRADAAALTEAFYAYGFRLSFGEHKTAAIVSLCGARSREVKKRLYGRSGLRGSIPTLLEHLPAVSLPLPANYKHLGVLQSPAGAVRDEIQHRVAQARSTFSEARRKVYKSKAVALAKKAVLLSSTVLPKLLQGAGAWPPLTKRSLVSVPVHEDQRLTAHACFSLLQLPSLSTLLRLARLSYLSQFIRSGPPEVWAAVRSDQPYASLLRADLRWLFDPLHLLPSNPRWQLGGLEALYCRASQPVQGPL